MMLKALANKAPRMRLAAGSARWCALKFPGPKEAEEMPRHMSQIAGTQLFMLAKIDGPSQMAACRERLRREIMHVDGVNWMDAMPKLLEINKYNSEALILVR